MPRPVGSNRLEFASRAPAAKAAMDDVAAGCTPDESRPPVPSVVHQLWLGGGKPMYAKLLSVLSILSMLCVLSMLSEPLHHVNAKFLAMLIECIPRQYNRHCKRLNIRA